MSSEFNITAVSADSNSWSSQYGQMVTYRIKLAENGDAIVQLNKKADSPTPVVGDKLFGDINRTEFGDKFKSAKRPFAGAGGGYQKDDAAISAMWAIGQAVQWHKSPLGNNEPEDLELIEATAIKLYAMVDRVKVSKTGSL